MRTSGLVSVAVSLLLVAAAGGSSASAAPQGPWVHPVVDLSAAGQSADLPQIAVSPDGTVTAIWLRSDGSNNIIQAATRPTGGGFGPPVDLSAPGQGASDPQIAFALDGSAVAVWRRSDGSNSIIQTATRPPGGSFGPTIDLSLPGEDANDPQIAIAPDGTATVVWYRFDGSHNIIQAATRPPGDSFGPPVDLSAAGQNAFGPQVDAAPDGTATAVWYRLDGADFIVQAATRPPGGSFGAAVDLSVSGEGAFLPQIATAPDGTSTAVWARSDGTHDIVQAATRPPGGAFGSPIDLSAVGQDADVPQIAVGSDGTATAVWLRSNGTNFIVQAATRLPGGAFGSPIDLSVTGQNASNPEIAVAPDGTDTAVWLRSDGSKKITQSSARPPGGGFSAPLGLSAAGQSASNPHVAVALDGVATAVWNRFNGSGDSIVQSISTAQPSIALGVANTGSRSGTVTSTPPGIDCGIDCFEGFPSFTEVTLTATPESGSTFEGWGGACEGAVGNTCELTMLDDQEVTAGFETPPPPTGKAKLKITKFKPKKLKVKRGEKAKIKVTGKNVGDATAANAKLCLKLKKGIKKKLKPKGKTCQKLGSLAPGKAKTKPFKLKATGKAKKGKKYKIRFKLSAKGANAVTRAIRVKVR